MNITIFDMYATVLPINHTYAVLGILAMLSNTFVLAAYLFKDTLRKHFVLFIFIAIADFVNGLAFFYTSIVRISKVWAVKNTYDYPNTMRYECASEINQALMLIGSQWPALLTLVLGMERFVAVKFPVTYYKFPKHYLFLSLLTLFLVFVSMAVALFIGLILLPKAPVEYLCTMTSAYAWAYSTFHYLSTSLGHTLGFAFNLIALLLALKSFKKSGLQKTNLQKEMGKIKLTFMISFCSVIFVVVPNIILYLYRWIGFQYEAMGWLYCAFLLRSCFNIYVIGFANMEFKNRVFEILRKILLKNNVYPNFIKVKTPNPASHSPNNVTTIRHRTL